jgi:hypothetical protein
MRVPRGEHEREQWRQSKRRELPVRRTGAGHSAHDRK